MNNEQRGELLTILKTKVSTPELRELTFRILGPNVWTNFDGVGHNGKCMDFIELIVRDEKENDTLNFLLNSHPDWDFTALGAKSNMPKNKVGNSSIEVYTQQNQSDISSNPIASPNEPDLKNHLNRHILIVTVTKVEAQSINDVFSKITGKSWNRLQINDKTYYDLGSISGANICMVQSEMGTATPGGALMTVIQAIQDIKPQAIIMCGISFGFRPIKQKLGDILISKQILYYEPQKVDISQGEMPRGDRATASERLLDRFRSADNDWTGPKRHFGLILSGEKLVNDIDFRNVLLNKEPEAIGGEMEAAGLYVAAREAKVDWILVKAICDWADGTKNDDAQSLAARNAAEFLLYALQLGILDNSSHFPGTTNNKPTKEEIASADTIFAKEPIFKTFVSFVNRHPEWEEIVQHPRADYYIFDAPAGYGKTALFKKISDDHAESQLCIHIKFKNNPPIKKVFKLFKDEFSKALNNIDLQIHSSANKFGIELGENVARIIGGSKDTIILLLDEDGPPSEAFFPTLREILDVLVPGIWQGLTTSPYFKRPHSFRVVVAGRFITSRIRDLEYFRIRGSIRKQLEPFDYEVVRDLCSKYTTDEFDQDEFAAHLLFYSGGHPRSMAQIFEGDDGFKRSGCETLLDFFDQCEDTIKYLAEDEASRVHASIDRSWRRIFDELCLFRRVDDKLLEKLIADKVIHYHKSNDGADLAFELQRSSLMNWKEDSSFNQLGDDITRRLLVLHQLYSVPVTDFENKCRKAGDYCFERLNESPNEMKHLWAVETLFCILQSYMPKINQGNLRDDLRLDFQKELKRVIQALIATGNPRLELNRLIMLIDEDKEFQFALNYHLRLDHYNDLAFKNLKQAILQ